MVGGHAARPVAARRQPATSAAALTSPTERLERRRRRQFAHAWQPPPWMWATFTADMGMDVIYVDA